VGRNIDRRGLLLRIEAVTHMMDYPSAQRRLGRSHSSRGVCMKSYFVRLVVRSEVRRTFVGVVPMLLGALTAAHGQLITPKTVPIHQDDQFAIFPTARAGMAGVSIALDDTLADPFANPAKATNVRIGRVFTAPFSHGISAGHGCGSTLPVGGVASTGPWAVAGVVAL